jgi:molybdate transport system substrate-binding protein
MHVRWNISPLFILLLCFACTSGVQAQSLHISVAASMTDVCKALMADFSTEHPQAEFFSNFASSGALAKQIEQGAPADIYVSANPRWTAYLLDKRLIVPGSDHIFAYNTLVFIGAKKHNPLSLDKLPNLERIALGSPQNVPAGQYARQAMENAGIYGLLKRERKLVMAKDVRQALLYADRGEVDGAFVYATDARLARHAVLLFTVPSHLHDRISYPVALTISGNKNTLAHSFYTYLGTAAAADILSEFGFKPAR